MNQANGHNNNNENEHTTLVLINMQTADRIGAIRVTSHFDA